MPDPQPDIVILLTDEERAAPGYETAEIQAWREQHLVGRRWFTDNGVDFRRHYVASTACVPSRPSLLTGHYPDVHGVTQTDGLGKRATDSRMRWLKPDEVPTMGHWLRAAGYDTAYVGKWHVSHADLIVDGRRLRTNTSEGELIPEAIDAYLAADPLDEFGFSGWVGPEPHGGHWSDTGYVRDPIYADRAVAWLQERYQRRAAGDEAAARPFLLICSFVNPHDIVLWPLLAMQRRRGHTLAPSLAEPPPIPPSPTDDEDLSTKPALQSAYRDGYYSAYGPAPLVRRAYEGNAERYRQTYYRLHHDVDTPIDRVRRAVTEGGSSDAVLVFSADHGDLLGSHGGLHQKWYQLYDEATRVPLQIVRVGAAATAAAVVDEPTSHIDLLPTLLGLAGADESALGAELADTHSEVHRLPGRDLSDVLSAPEQAPRDSVYLMTRDNMLEGDGSSAAMLAARGRVEAPYPLQIKVPSHAATNLEAVVGTVDGRLWKLVRTFDDPAIWTEPHLRQLSARTPAGPVYRSEPIPDQWELYCLSDDPMEADNQWDNPDHEEVFGMLKETLERIRGERIPERNADWPTAPRKADPPKSKRPPLPARGLRSLLQKAGLHPEDPESCKLDLTGHRALIVATNHATLDVGKPTGVFASELTVPYYEFLDAGMEVDIASPRGGDVPFDPKSFIPIIRAHHDDRFLADDEAKEKVRNSLSIADLDMDDYDIVYFAGGWGAAWDLGTSDAVGEQVTAAAAKDKVLGGVCHGPLGLLKATTADGEPLVKGRPLTAVTDKQVEELGIGNTPQHPETELRRLGADFQSSHRRRDVFANHVVVDGDLITGQNQNAGGMVAREMMIRVLAKRDVDDRSPSPAGAN